MIYEKPFPHLYKSGDVEMYERARSNWKSEYKSAGNRSNVSITDKKLHNYCKGIMKDAYNQFLPTLKKEYPKWDFEEQKAVRFQYSTNYAHIKEYSSRDWHIDSGDKLIIGLWYFRDPNDGAGGNLQITNGDNEEIKEIEYEENVMVIFPNTTKSWHRVKERLPSKINRKFINMLVEQKTRLHSYTRGREGNDSFKNVENYYD